MAVKYRDLQDKWPIMKTYRDRTELIAYYHSPATYLLHNILTVGGLGLIFIIAAFVAGWIGAVLGFGVAFGVLGALETRGDAYITTARLFGSTLRVTVCREEVLINEHAYFKAHIRPPELLPHRGQRHWAPETRRGYYDCYEIILPYGPLQRDTIAEVLGQRWAEKLFLALRFVLERNIK